MFSSVCVFFPFLPKQFACIQRIKARMPLHRIEPSPMNVEMMLKLKQNKTSIDLFLILLSAPKFSKHTHTQWTLIALTQRILKITHGTLWLAWHHLVRFGASIHTFAVVSTFSMIFDRKSMGSSCSNVLHTTSPYLIVIDVFNNQFVSFCCSVVCFFFFIPSLSIYLSCHSNGSFFFALVFLCQFKHYTVDFLITKATHTQKNESQKVTANQSKIGKKKETKRHECPLTKGESNARSIVFGLVRLLAHILNRIFENAFLTDRCRDRKLSLKTVFSSLFQFTTISIFGVVHSFFSQTQTKQMPILTSEFHRKQPVDKHRKKIVWTQHILRNSSDTVGYPYQSNRSNNHVFYCLSHFF